MLLGNLLSPVNRTSAWIAGAAVVLMMVHICLDVVGKFVFNAPIPGTITTVTNYYMPIVTFLPLAFVHQMRAHISVEVLTTHFSGRIQHHLYFLAILVGAAIYGLLAFTTIEEAVTKMALGTFQTEQDLRIATWPGQFFPAVGYGLIAILLLLQFVDYLRGKGAMDSA